MTFLYVEAKSKELLANIQAILFDWAGTTIDHGCMAPTQVFHEIFRLSGIEIRESEARGPMGQAKVDHIRTMLNYPRIQGLWQERYGRAPNEQDVEDLYATFLPLQKEILSRHADMIPGAVHAIAACRKHGLKIGSTTGYTRELMDVVQPLAEAQGYRPEVTICSDEVVSGRPAPWQLYRAAEQLQIYPMQRILVIDDSMAGIEAGKHAGCVTAAVTATGNAMGLTVEQWEALNPEERRKRIESISREFIASGADIVLESVAELPTLWSWSR